MTKINGIKPEEFNKLKNKKNNTKIKKIMDSVSEEEINKLTTDENTTYEDGSLYDGSIKVAGEEVNFFKNGIRYTIKIDKGLIESLNDLNSSYNSSLYNNVDAKLLAKTIDVFKKANTSWSPLFLIRNPFRDVQDAIYYADAPIKLIKKFPAGFKEAAKGILTKKGSKYWDLYQGMGGLSNSYFENGVFNEKAIKGTKRNKKFFNRALTLIPSLNLITEQGPRLAEFMRTLEKNGINENNFDKITENIAKEAMWNADDITVNFGRNSKISRNINRYVVPFWNPAWQGFDKFIRRFEDDISQSYAKGMVRIGARMAFAGTSAIAINVLLKEITKWIIGDDEEELKKFEEAYNDESDYYKQSHFLIYNPNGGEKDENGEMIGTFLRIPMGRVTSGFYVIGNDMYKKIFKGEDVDIKDSLLYLYEQVYPLGTSPIWSTWFDAQDNKTWYGGEIESVYDRDYPTEFRGIDDPTIDNLSKKLAQTSFAKNQNLSPKKINYLLKQYSGVFGDALIPLITDETKPSKSNSAFETIMSYLGGVINNSFFDGLEVDPVYSNNISSEYFETKEEIGQIANYQKDKLGKEGTPEQVLDRFFTNSSIKTSKLYKEMNEIRKSDDKDKAEKLRKLQYQINKEQKETLSLYKEIKDDVYNLYEKRQKNGESISIDDLNNILIKDGSEEASKKALDLTYYSDYNKSHVKMQQQITLLKDSGISYKDIASYFVYANDVQYTPKDEIGDKQNALLKKVNSLNLSKEQKALLLFSTPSWTDRYNDNEILNRYEVKGGQLGYSSTYEAREDVANYIINANHLSQKQKLEMAELAGFEIGEDEGGKYIKW